MQISTARQAKTAGARPSRGWSGCEQQFSTVEQATRRTLRTHGPAFKVRVVSPALREDNAIAERRKELDLHAGQVIERKRRLLQDAGDIFADSAHAAAPVGLASLHARTGRPALENDLSGRPTEIADADGAWP